MLEEEPEESLQESGYELQLGSPTILAIWIPDKAIDNKTSCISMILKMTLIQVLGIPEGRH